MVPRRHVSLLATLLALAGVAQAQLNSLTREQMVKYTAQNPFDRFPDGRPMVPDALLSRFKDITAEEAWDVLQDAGFRNQFEGGWKVLNPGERLVGRVVTAVFMPHRPDVDAEIQANGKKEARGGGENSWVG